MLSAFLNDEAELSGDDSGDEGMDEDMDDAGSLENFIVDDDDDNDDAVLQATVDGDGQEPPAEEYDDTEETMQLIDDNASPKHRKIMRHLFGDDDSDDTALDDEYDFVDDSFDDGQHQPQQPHFKRLRRTITVESDDEDDDTDSVRTVPRVKVERLDNAVDDGTMCHLPAQQPPLRPITPATTVKVEKVDDDDDDMPTPRPAYHPKTRVLATFPTGFRLPLAHELVYQPKVKVTEASKGRLSLTQVMLANRLANPTHQNRTTRSSSTEYPDAGARHTGHGGLSSMTSSST